MGRLGCLALIFFGFFAFSNAIQHPFVNDDVAFILQNPHITELGSWAEAFKAPAVSNDVNPYYRPVLEVLYRLEYYFFGPHPFGYHLFNVVVHIINGLLLFGLLKKLAFPENVAWVIACIFLVHPVQTEAVSCIAGISNLWMALGVLLALNAYVDKRYMMSMAFFIIAFLSKEQGILFVPLVIVIDYYSNMSFPRKRGSFIHSWIFLTIVACILLWLRQCVTGASLLKDILAAPHELSLRLAAIPRVMGMDLRLIFWPYDLHYYRSTDILQSNSIAWIMALVSILGIFYVLHRWRTDSSVITAQAGIHSRMILGLGWFLAALLPVLNVAPLINEYSFILTPEHFLYLPVVGILIIIVVAADHFIKYSRKLILGVVISGCLLLTWHQNTFWRSETALFERMLRFEPNFGRGHLLLAKAYYFDGQPGQAEEHFEKAFTIMSAYAEKASNPSAEKFYLGFVKEILFDWAQNDSARGYWAKALDKYKRAALIDGKDASLYNNMAFVYLHMGDKKDAYVSLKQALRVDPSFTQARSNLEKLGSL